MAGIITRVIASFDRIPAVHAFIFMLFTGALAGFAIFGMTPTPALEIRPLGVLFLIVTLALALMSFSKPVVVRRDKGTIFARFRQELRHFATMLALQVVLFAVVIIPAYFVKSSSSSPTNPQRDPADSTTATASSSNSLAKGNSPKTATSAAPSSRVLPTESAAPIASTAAVSTTVPSAANATTSATGSSRVPAKAIADKPGVPREFTGPSPGDDAVE